MRENGVFCLVANQERKQSGGRSTRTFLGLKKVIFQMEGAFEEPSLMKEFSHQSQAFQNYLSPEIKKIPKAVKEK